MRQSFSSLSCIAALLGVVVTLSSCGGGNQPAPPPGPAPDVLTSALAPIQGPECIADTTGRWVSALTQAQADSPTPPPKKFFMAVRYVHSIDTPITSNFGRKGDLVVTNFDPEAGVQSKDYGRWQRGKVDGDAGVTSGFQMKCDDVGSHIDTATFPQQTLIGNGPQAAYFYDFRDPADPATLSGLPPVFDADPATDFVLQARVENPLLRRSGPADDTATGSLAVAQLSMAAYLRDSESGKLFAYVVNLYQNRSAEPTQIAQDEEVAYVSTAWQTNEFVTVPAASAGFTSDTWTGLRLYRVHVPRAKFSVALARLNTFCAAPANRNRPFCQAGAGGTTFSTDPRNYQLVAFGMLHEVFTGRLDNQVASGVHYKAVGAYRARP